MTKKKERLSRGERTLLIAVSIFATLLLAHAYWHYTLEINPVISLPAPAPAPVLPHPNARDYYDRACSMLRGLPVTAGRRSYTYGFNELLQFCQGNAQAPVNAGLPAVKGPPAPTWAIAEAFVKLQAPAFATLHQGFAHEYYAVQSPIAYPKLRIRAGYRRACRCASRRLGRRDGQPPPRCRTTVRGVPA